MPESPLFRISSIFIITLFIALLPSTSLAGSAYCQKSCTVILKNGNNIEADSYRVEGCKIFLKYPVGEVSFNLSQVESITGGDGSEPFQDKGKAQPVKAASAPEKPVLPAPAIASLPAARDLPVDTKAAYKDQPFAAQPELEMTAEDDPVEHAAKEQKFQDFFEKYRQASEVEQAEMSKQMDKVFSDYLSTGTPPPLESGD